MSFISYFNVKISLKVMYEEASTSPDNLTLNKNPFYTMQVEKTTLFLPLKIYVNMFSMQFWCDRKQHEKNAL